MGCIKEADSSDHNATVEQKANLSQNRQDSTGDPVNVVTGAFTLTEKDISIRSQQLFITITRHYNNQHHGTRQDPIPFGHGWTHSLNLYLKPGPAPFQVSYVDDKGTSLVFSLVSAPVKLSSGEFKLDRLEDGTLEIRKQKKLVSKFDAQGSRLSDHPDDPDGAKLVVGNVLNQLLFVDSTGTLATFTVSFSNSSFVSPVGALGLSLTYQEDYGFLLRQADGLMANFRSDGKLVRLIRPGVQKDSVVNLDYDELNRLCKVTGSGNRFIEIAYLDEKQTIKSIKDNSGRIWEYEYNKHEELVIVRDPGTRVRRYDYSGWEGTVSIGKGQTELRKIRAMSRVYGYRFEASNEQEWVELSNQYTSDRRVALQKDSFGHRTRFDYNLFTRTTSVTDPNGWTTIYCYDSNGNTTKVRKPTGGTREYIYDDYGNLLAEFDEFSSLTLYVQLKDVSRLNTQFEYGRRLLGNRSDYVALGQEEIITGYDERGNRPLVIDALGAKTEFLNYSAFGKPTLIRLPDSTTVSYVYDSRSGLPLRAERNLSVGRENSLKKVMQWEYDDYGNVVSYTDWAESTKAKTTLIKTIQSIYDDAGNLLSRKEWINDKQKGEDFARHEKFQWDSVGRLIEFSSYRKQDPDAKAEIITTKIGYDLLDREIWRIDPYGVGFCQQYDAVGHIIETFFVLDFNPQEFAALDPKRKLEKNIWHFDHNGNEILHIDSAGLQTSRSWTKTNRLQKLRKPTGFTLNYQYDKDDNNIEERWSTGYSVKRNYDIAGRLIEQVDSHQKRIIREYDPMGKIIAFTAFFDGHVNKTSFEYDLLGRVTAVKHGDGSIDKYVLNEENEVVKYTREMSQTIQDKYIEEHKYDSLGRKTDIYVGTTKGSRRVLHVEYDDSLRAVDVFDPLGNRKRTFFDTHGNAISHIGAKGRRVFNAYDLADRPKRRWSEDETITSSYTYDHAGRMISSIEREFETLWMYDHNGRLTSTTQKAGESTTTINYEYSETGCLTKKYANQYWWMNYAYTTGTPFVKKIDLPGLQLQIEVDDTGRVIDEIWNSGAKSSYEYNNGGNISKLSITDRSGKTIFSQQIEYDVLSRPIRDVRSQLATGHSYVYQYDGLNRLVNVQVGEKEKKDYRRYAYDIWGNRTDEYREGGLHCHYNYDSANRLLTAQTDDGNLIKYDYDESGNMTKKGDLSFIYDPFDRLDSVISEKTGQVIRTNSYNGLDLLCKTISGDKVEVTIFDQLQEIMNLQNNNVTETTYWGFDFDAIVAHSTASQKLSRTITDAMGSVIGYGELISSSYMDPFGLLNSSNPDQVDFGFCGKRYDNLTGLYLNRARYYDPAIGRFTQPDPLGYAGDGLNLYIYSKNNPLTYTDPLGLSSSKYSTGQIMQMLEPGHLIERHVGKTVSELWQRLEAEPHIPAATTFTNLATAIDVVATALHQNDSTIQTWLSSGEARLELTVSSNYSVGFGVARHSSEPISLSASTVILGRSSSLSSGFYIRTGYPKMF